VKAKEAEDKAKEAEEKATKAAREKAEQEGRWGDVVKIANEAAEKARAEAAEKSKRVTELEAYEATVKSEVESLVKELGNDAVLVAGLTPAQALPILRKLKANAAGPGAAPRTTAGNPPPPPNTPDLSKMTPEQLRDHIAGLTPDARAKLLQEQTGATPSQRPAWSAFGGVKKKE
jgi:hypothetical protein